MRAAAAWRAGRRTPARRSPCGGTRAGPCAVSAAGGSWGRCGRDPRRVGRRESDGSSGIRLLLVADVVDEIGGFVSRDQGTVVGHPGPAMADVRVDVAV